MIRYAVWLYYRFPLSLRDVEELLAEREIDVTYETVRCWRNKFGPVIAANLRRARPQGHSTWHLDEMVLRIGGKRMYMWHAVVAEGKVLDMLLQKRRNKGPALRLLRRLLKNQVCVPEVVVTDGLASYRAALKVLGGQSRHQPGGAVSPVRTSLHLAEFGLRTHGFSLRASATPPRQRSDVS